MSAPTPESVRKTGWVFTILAAVLFFIGVAGFGTPSSGSVTMFGLTMEAKYACAISFVLGAVFLYAVTEAKKHGYWP